MTPTDPFASLFDPPGQYALTPFGNTHAVVLTGSHAFQTRAYNLFAGWATEGLPLTPLHSALIANTVYFCVPADRARKALARFLFTQLYATKGARRDVVDAEGDYLDTVCDNEAALWEEAEQLACDFIVNHMRPNWRALPSYEEDTRPVVEHGFGVLGASEESD